MLVWSSSSSPASPSLHSLVSEEETEQSLDRLGRLSPEAAESREPATSIALFKTRIDGLGICKFSSARLFSSASTSSAAEGTATPFDA